MTNERKGISHSLGMQYQNLSDLVDYWWQMHSFRCAHSCIFISYQLDQINFDITPQRMWDPFNIYIFPSLLIATQRLSKFEKLNAWWSLQRQPTSSFEPQDNTHSYACTDDNWPHTVKVYIIIIFYCFQTQIFFQMFKKLASSYKMSSNWFIKKSGNS